MARLMMRGWLEYSEIWGKVLAGDPPRHQVLTGSLSEESDVIFVNGRDQDEVGLYNLLLSSDRPKVIVYVHDMPIEEWRQRYGSDVAGWPEDLQVYFEILRYCDRVVTQTNYWAAKVSEFLGSDNVLCMDMGLDVDRMVGWQENVAGKLENKWDVGYVSRFVPHKGQMDLLLALSELNRSLSVALVGRKYDRGYFFELLKSVPSKVRLTLALNGPASFVYEVTARSSVAVSPSTFEGWGMFPARAAWFGVPMVLYDIPVYRELYSKYATLVPKGDVHVLGEEIDKVLKNREKYQAQIAAFSGEIQERWGKNGFFKRFWELIGAL